MPVIQLEASPEALLAAVSQLPPETLRAFAAQVASLDARRLAACLSADESALMIKINGGLSDREQQRFDELVGKRQQGSLTSEELHELTALTDEVERQDAARLADLTALARLRGVSRPELMHSLGIRSPTDG